MAIPSTAQSFQVLISSNDRVNGTPAMNDYWVNILGDVNVDQEYYVRLLAADIECSVNSGVQGRMHRICTIHANFGQQSILSSNAQNRSNFLGVYVDGLYQSGTNGGHGVVEAQPYIRCSRPNLGEVNIQIRNPKTGELALPSPGSSIENSTFLVEFIPINYNRVRADLEGYVVPRL